MKNLKKDLLLYTFLIILSVLFYFVFIPQQIALKDSWSGDIVFTSRTFPNLLFITMGIFSSVGLILTVLKVNKLNKLEGKSEEKFDVKEFLAPILFFALLALYALLFDLFGYIIATIVIIPTYLIALKCKKWQYYAITYTIGVIIYVVFKFVLNIAL